MMKRHLHLHLGSYHMYPASMFNYQIATGFSLMIDGYNHLVSIEHAYHLDGETYDYVRVPRNTWSIINVYWLQILYGITCIKQINVNTMLKHHFTFDWNLNRFLIRGLSRTIPLHLMIHDTRTFLSTIGWNHFPVNTPVPNNFTKQHEQSIYNFTHQYTDGSSEEIEQ